MGDQLLGRDRTVTCAHDSHVVLNTSPKKSTFHGCLKESSSEQDPLVGRVPINEISWFPALLHFFLVKNGRVLPRICF